MSESAYNSPLPTRRLTESCCSSPARSIGGGGGHMSDILTDSDGEGGELFTEIPGHPDQTVISGWLKFRDNKKVRNLPKKSQQFTFIQLLYLGDD